MEGWGEPTWLSLRPEIQSTLVVEIQDALQGNLVAAFLREETKALVELPPVPQDGGYGGASALSPDTIHPTPVAEMHQRLCCCT